VRGLAIDGDRDKSPLNGKTMIENGGRRLVVRPVAIGGGHIALEALDDRILDVLALVRVPYEYSHAQILRVVMHRRT